MQDNLSLREQIEKYKQSEKYLRLHYSFWYKDKELIEKFVKHDLEKYAAKTNK